MEQIEYDIKVFERMIPKLRDCIVFLETYQLLKKETANILPKPGYLVYWINASLCMGILGWAMIFGSDNNEIHWKRVIISDSEKDKFREALYNQLKMSPKEFEKYWVEVKRFRNNFIE